MVAQTWIDKGKPIGLACDHAGYELKEKLREHLLAAGFQVKDFGAHSTERTDYPDFGSQCARAVARGECAAGILVCATGIGMSIVANKIRGIRAALCDSVTTARLSRQHNDANVLALGGKLLGELLAFEIVDTWLSTPFEGGRHARRVQKIAELDRTEP
ncbi:MAG: ribose 5-phosphate isomerase B [candidate division KSB1 bacterium]|nr:ribose 5-phosphate isomerase B [candidate division KSB1 bacterium]